MYLYFRAKLYSVVCAGILLEIGDILDYIDGDLARFDKRICCNRNW